MYVVYGCTSFSEVPSNSAISIVDSVVGGIGNGFNGARHVDNVSRNRILCIVYLESFRTIDYNFFFLMRIFMKIIKSILFIRRLRIVISYLKETNYKNLLFKIVIAYLYYLSKLTIFNF